MELLKKGLIDKMRLIDLDSDYIQETIYRRRFKTRQDIEEWLNNAPTIDAVPVVRCKDCKKGELVPDFDGLYSCRGKRKPLHDPDDFCNFGVKREDG